MTGVVYRYEVPVDEEWHMIALTGPILHVHGRRRDVVEFWAIHQPAHHEYTSQFRVFVTGDPLPDRTRHVGTAVIPPYVWHLFEQLPPLDWEKPA